VEWLQKVRAMQPAAIPPAWPSTGNTVVPYTPPVVPRVTSGNPSSRPDKDGIWYPGKVEIPERGGIINALAEKVSALAGGIVERVWPLKACVELGERLCEVSTRTKVLSATLCGAASGLIAVRAGVGWPGIAAAAAAGAIGGWASATLAGSLLIVAALLVGLLIALSIIAIVIGLIFWVVKVLSGG
jgi:hypothetical protein